MGLLDQIRDDVHDIITDIDDFSVPITLTDTNGVTVNVTGLHTKHFMNIDSDGVMISSKNAHISVSERSLVEAGYTVRDGNGEVNLLSHIVTVADSTGLDKQYQIKTAMPNETIGLITCVLGIYYNANSTVNNYVVDDYVEDYFQ